jgi:hypothetical protein
MRVPTLLFAEETVRVVDFKEIIAGGKCSRVFFPLETTALPL